MDISDGIKSTITNKPSNCDSIKFVLQQSEKDSSYEIRNIAMLSISLDSNLGLEPFDTWIPVTIFMGKPTTINIRLQQFSSMFLQVVQ